MTSAAEPTTPVWPRWEVQGYGTVTCATPPGDPCALPPHQLVPPWVDIRLTFADGARVDVLAVLRDGVIAVEDAQADPPLPLDDLSGLAAWIEAPLAYASRAVAAQHRLAPDQEPRDASDPAPGTRRRRPPTRTPTGRGTPSPPRTAVTFRTEAATRTKTVSRTAAATRTPILTATGR